MTLLSLTIASMDGTNETKQVSPTRVYNLGSATVDPSSALAHQQEVKDVGVQIAFDIPAPRVYPLAVTSVTTDTEIAAHHARTSGEAEIVLLINHGVTYLGIGSDHTDRDLEKHSIIWAKQYSPSVLGTTFWLWDEVEPHWSSLILESTVEGAPYQSSPASVFLRPPEILTKLAERVKSLPETFLVFCGTYTTLTNTIAFGSEWAVSLRDEECGRRLDLAYTVTELLDEIQPAHRVPVLPRRG